MLKLAAQPLTLTLSHLRAEGMPPAFPVCGEMASVGSPSRRLDRQCSRNSALTIRSSAGLIRPEWPTITW